jgi:hypothetical protein
MTQSVTTRPEPNLQRKSAIAYAGARDYTGHVDIKPIAGFDLNRTIFQTLESPIARYIMTQRVGKHIDWHTETAGQVQTAYASATESLELPEVSPALMDFLVTECNFDVEHADGSFLDHLYFCFEYTLKYYPQGLPLVMLLHSILGTGTNTFAMSADKIPALQALMTEQEWVQTEAFPSVLRLLYDGGLRRELWQNLGRNIRSISMQRVIDNAPISLTGDEFWEAMNYQLIHLVDFMPVANWAVHQNDTSYILFRDVYSLMNQAAKRHAEVTYNGPEGRSSLECEEVTMGGWLATKVPVSLAEKMAAKSVRRFSEMCGHSLDYAIEWA